MQHTTTLNTHVFETSTTKTNTQNTFIQTIEEQRLVLFPAILLFLLCFNGVVASFGTQGSFSEIVMVLLPNVLTISFVIGVAPTRWVLSAFAFNIIMNIIVLWI